MGKITKEFLSAVLDREVNEVLDDDRSKLILGDSFRKGDVCFRSSGLDKFVFINKKELAFEAKKYLYNKGYMLRSFLGDDKSYAVVFEYNTLKRVYTVIEELDNEDIAIIKASLFIHNKLGGNNG